MLKPNLVNAQSEDTTNPEVVKALAVLMKKSGKEVLIGEGSAAAPRFNVKDGVSCRTKKPEILDPMQQFVFDELGYTELAKSLNVPLVNLHSGEIAEVDVPGGVMIGIRPTHRRGEPLGKTRSTPRCAAHASSSWNA